MTLNEIVDTLDESEESIKLTASTVSTVDENGDANARIKTSQDSIDLSIIDNELTTVELTTPSSKLIYGEADGSIVITAEIANVKPFDTALTLAMTSGVGYATIDQDYSTDDDGYSSLNLYGFSIKYNSFSVSKPLTSTRKFARDIILS